MGGVSPASTSSGKVWGESRPPLHPPVRYGGSLALRQFLRKARFYSSIYFPLRIARSSLASTREEGGEEEGEEGEAEEEEEEEEAEEEEEEEEQQ